LPEHMLSGNRETPGVRYARCIGYDAAQHPGTAPALRHTPLPDGALCEFDDG
jgi:hypothetical protein